MAGHNTLSGSASGSIQDFLKIISVLIILEYITTLNAPHNDVVQRS
jgi:hypothetical protein